MKQSLDIKICGLSTPETLDAVIDGGAAYAGFIFFEKSPRHINLATARTLGSQADSRIKKVAVSVNADDDYLSEIVDALRPEFLQLHGSETPERVGAVKAKFGLPIIKAIAISEIEDFDKATPHIGIADMFLFDAKPPKGSDLPGGNGVAFDWELMDQWDPSVPYMLSGGLDVQNVVEAVTRSQASAIDISSGVESAPGLKNVSLITEFLKTCSEIKDV